MTRTIGDVLRHHYSGQVETLHRDVSEPQAEEWILRHGRKGQTFDAYTARRCAKPYERDKPHKPLPKEPSA